MCADFMPSCHLGYRHDTNIMLLLKKKEKYVSSYFASLTILTQNILGDQATAMAANTMAPCVAGPSIDMALIM